MSPARPTDDALAETLLAILAEANEGSSIDPSDVPRRLLGETGPWRGELKRVRKIAARLAGEGQIVILRHGKPMTDSPIKGVVRLARGPRSKL